MSSSTKLLLNERFIALVGVLNRELVLLERLAFKLTEAELLTRGDGNRFLAQILDEVEMVGNDLGALDVARAMLVSDITAALGITNDNLPLGELISHAPDLALEPLGGLLRGLTEAMSEVKDLRESGSRAVIERLDQLHKAIERVEPGVFGQDVYDQQGLMAVPTSATATRFDYSI